MSEVEYSEENTSGAGRGRSIKWEKMKAKDCAKEIEVPGDGCGSVQVFGKFSGATVVIQGSNDGKNWKFLKNRNNYPLDFSEDDLSDFNDAVRFMRPIIVGGDNETEISVILYVKVGR